jgi:catechol 2,3-dioxygenase-like lactoylglutathione lyase family enzyme
VGDVRVGFRSARFDAARAFYETTLGMGVVTEWDDVSGRGVVLRAFGDGCVELFDEPAGPLPVGLLLGIEVSDVGAAREHLVAAGVSAGPLVDQPWGHRNFTTHDPDGNAVTLFQVIAGH